MNKKSFLQRIAVLFLTVLLFSAPFASAAQAAEKAPLLLPPTTSKTVVLLFYKQRGSSVPDAKVALEQTEAYKAADSATQQTMVANERSALSTEYATLDPKRNVITIRTAVEMKANTTTAPGIKVTLPMSNPVYFPYAWGDTKVAVIPDKIETYLDIPMDITEASAAASKINNGVATMVLELSPMSTDRLPMALDGVSQWLLMCRVLAVTYYNPYLQEIWSWKAPSYKRADNTAIRDLKK